MDETTLQVNQEADRAAHSTSYMWLQRGGPPGQQIVLFDYDASRAGRVPVRLLGDYAGRLITDGYEGYAEVVRRNSIAHAGCWAHARRKFVEAQKVQPKGKTGKADWAINQIRKLYAVEKQAQGMTPEARQALRDQKSRPLIQQLRTWLDKSRQQVLPKSALGKALHYLDGQWDRLTCFLHDGLIPLDNNPAKNAIRPFVVGRKNWLFSHTPRGAHASAAIYSLIETALCRPPNYAERFCRQAAICGLFRWVRRAWPCAPFGIALCLTATQGRQAGCRPAGNKLACRARGVQAWPGPPP